MTELEFSSGRKDKLVVYELSNVKANSRKTAEFLVASYIRERESAEGAGVEVFCRQNPFEGYDCLGVVSERYSFFPNKGE